MSVNVAQMRAWKRAIGLGTLAGLRSMSAPALLSHAASRHDLGLAGTPFAWFGSPVAAIGFQVLAGGEIMADKSPKMPPRTAPIALMGRAGLGALVGAAVFSAEEQPPALGAALGAVAAIVASFGSYKLRQQATVKWGVPNVAAGLIEDGVVAAGSYALMSSVASK